MTASLTLVVLMAVLFGAGVSIMLERSLTRVLIGILLLGNGANLLILAAGGPPGAAPILGRDEGPISDPLPQVMVLTAIVITFGLTAFLLALAHRSWQLFGHDEVQDDVEDRRIRIRAERERAEVHLEELTDPGSAEVVSDTEFEATFAGDRQREPTGEQP